MRAINKRKYMHMLCSVVLFFVCSLYVTPLKAATYTNKTYGFAYTYNEKHISTQQSELKESIEDGEPIYIGDHGIILKIGNEEIHPRSEHCTLDDPDYIDGILEKPESEAACFGNEKLSMRSVFDCKMVKINGIFFKEYYICKDKIYAFRVHDSRAKIYEVFYVFDGLPKNKNIFEKILKTFHLTQITH